MNALTIACDLTRILKDSKFVLHKVAISGKDRTCSIEVEQVESMLDVEITIGLDEISTLEAGLLDILTKAAELEKIREDEAFNEDDDDDDDADDKEDWR